MFHAELTPIISMVIIVSSFLTSNANDLPGHLQPLGSHRPPMQVDVKDGQLNPIEFFDNYVKPSKPVLLKGAAKNFPSFLNWRNDEYLKKKHGEWWVQAEKGKKETRSGEGNEMSFKKFLDVYNKSDLYLVSDILPNSTMATDVYLPKCLLCGGFAESIVVSVMWFSSGGTKSVLHNDDVDNINCLYDGEKRLVMIDKIHKELVPIDRPDGGFSSVDVDRVDMNKFPTLSQVPWYEANMEAGDCFFIPFEWYHHVSSSKSRNLAINIWFSYLKYLPSREECINEIPHLPDYRPLTSVTFLTDVEQSRMQLLNFFDPSKEVALDELATKMSLPDSDRNSEIYQTLSSFFNEWDADQNGKLAFSEVSSLPSDSVSEFMDLHFAIKESNSVETKTKPQDPPGHLQPLGSHRPPLPIEVRSDWPTPIEFFEKYTKEGKPVLFRGLAKQFPGFHKFQSDSYLREHHGDWKIVAEEGKKENRSKGTADMSFAQFIDTYQQSDIYLVEDVYPHHSLADNVFLPKSLLCGGYTKSLRTSVMWFSSGSTKSVLHNDGFDNLNCLFDGTKDLLLIDKKHEANVPIDVPDGAYSSLDVERVDMYKYPTVQKLPWYSATMNAGDCLYIPLLWYHQVNSMPSRNLAINIWWAHRYIFQPDDCPANLDELSDYSKLSNYKFSSNEEKARSALLESFFNHSTGTASQEDFRQSYGRNSRHSMRRLFIEADKNQDSKLTYEEFYDLPEEAFDGFRLENEENEENDYNANDDTDDVVQRVKSEL